MKHPLLTASLLCTLACQAAPDSMQTLFDEWSRDPGRHPNLPDCSHAGYQEGDRPPPAPPVVATITDFGATPDDATDDTDAIRKAVASAAGKGGGAVMVPAGVWRICSPIFLMNSGVVLRGDGQEKTILHCTRPLKDSVGVNLLDGKSRWSWSGGMVWITPREIRGNLTDPPSDLSVSWKEGWRPGAELAKITGAAKRGDTEISIAANAPLPKPGTLVLVSLTDPGDDSVWRHLAGDLPGAAEYDWKTKASGMIAEIPVTWPVEIVSAKPGQVTLRQPLRFDLRPEWNPRLLASGPVIRDCGVEQLTVRMEPSALSAHLENPGWNGIYFENAVDCWASDVLVKDADNGIGTAASKRITVDRFTITGRPAHHATFCRVSSHDTLWTRFQIECNVHHGINVEGLSSGNVWSAGEMTHGTLDSHRALPYENLRTDLRIRNDGTHGGGDTAGPLFGTRFAHWNIEITNERPHMVNVPNMIPRGAVVAVSGAPAEPKPTPDFSGDLRTLTIPPPDTLAIPDLHLAQLTARLGKPPLHLGGPIHAVIRRTDGSRLRIEWADPQTTPGSYLITRKTEKSTEATEPVRIEPPARFYEDSNIAPGARYIYQIKPLLAGRESESVEIAALNKPTPVLNLTADSPGIEPTITLRWTPTPERGGELVISRRPQGAPKTETKPVATLPFDAVEYTDRSARAGSTWTYSITVRNASGVSPALETNAFSRATPVTLRTETFPSTTDTKLPAKGKLGTWIWKGTQRDRGPASRPGGSEITPDSADGELAWGVTPDTTQSFVWTDGVSGDFSQIGSEFGSDYQVGNSAVNTHTVAPCLRLADGSWIVTDATFIGPSKGWRTWSLPLKKTTKWSRLDPETLAVGPVVPAPDLRTCTAAGLRIDRPINNRNLQLDNIRIHANHVKQ